MKKQLLLSLVLFTAFSCSNNNTQPSISVDLSCTSVVEALNKIKSIHNYTVDVDIVEDGTLYTYQYYYTEKYFYSTYENLLEGYIESKDGIYRINNVEDKTYASELYRDENNNLIKSLWNSSLIYAINNFEIDKYTSSEKELVVTRKNDKIELMNLLYIDTTYLPYLKEAKFVLKGETLDTLSLYVNFGADLQFELSFYNFNLTSYDVVENYISSNKGHTVLDDTLSSVKSLFAMNNYRRTCYLNEDPSQKIIGYEWFNEEYFYNDFIDDSYLQYEQGFVSLPKKEKDGKKYDGAYLFFLDSNYQNLNFYGTAPAFTTNISSMIDIMNYPSKLEMFNYNLQFFEKIEDEANPGKEVYATTDLYLINDWINNFQIMLNTAEGEIPYIYDLRIIADIGSEAKDSIVTFQLDYTINGNLYGLQREFIDFGETYLSAVEVFLSEFTSYN